MLISLLGSAAVSDLDHCVPGEVAVTRWVFLSRSVSLSRLTEQTGLPKRRKTRGGHGRNVQALSLLEWGSCHWCPGATCSPVYLSAPTRTLSLSGGSTDKWVEREKVTDAGNKMVLGLLKLWFTCTYNSLYKAFHRAQDFNSSRAAANVYSAKPLKRTEENVKKRRPDWCEYIQQWRVKRNPKCTVNL